MTVAPARQVILLIGSNIEPVKNIRSSIEEIKKHLILEKLSSIWETKPIGTRGDNFLNLASQVQTNLDYESLKFGLLRSIEDKCGRIRTEDKFAPRTMDIDIILYDNVIMEENLWKYAYVAVPVFEITGEIIHPSRKTKLSAVVDELTKKSWISKYPAEV